MKHLHIRHLWILLLLTSCFKTADQIKREKAVDQMSVQLEQSSQMVAELTQQVNNLQNSLANTTGQIQEIDHFQKKSTEEQTLAMHQSISQLQAQVKALAEEEAENKKRIALLNSELEEQKKYTRKITKSLSKLAASSSADRGATYAQANKLFEASKMSEAKAAYLDVLEAGKINAAQRNAVWYNLGLINYRDKKYDDAVTYFSKIYTKWPRSSYAPRALLYIARSFAKDGKTAEANAAFSEVIKNYPDSSQAKAAKKEIEKKIN